VGRVQVTVMPEIMTVCFFVFCRLTSVPGATWGVPVCEKCIPLTLTLAIIMMMPFYLSPYSVPQ